MIFKHLVQIIPKQIIFLIVNIAARKYCQNFNETRKRKLLTHYFKYVQPCNEILNKLGSRSATNYKSFFNSFNSPMILNRSPIVTNFRNSSRNYRKLSFEQQLQVIRGRNVESRRKIETVGSAVSPTNGRRRRRRRKSLPPPRYIQVSLGLVA